MLAAPSGGRQACMGWIMTETGVKSLLRKYTLQSTEGELPDYLPPLTDDELSTVVDDIAMFAGVKPHRLRNGASTDRARPYRDALWWILNKKYGMTQRGISAYFQASRTTVGSGIRMAEDDEDRQRARSIILARMTRMGLGV